jgi:3-mercaptopyruvate sulfurtransferase SseA
VDNSLAYFRRRIAGSKFAAPDKLSDILRKSCPNSEPVIVSENGLLARVVARGLALVGIRALTLTGGTKGWVEAGPPTESGPGGEVLTGRDDTRYAGWESYLGVIKEPEAARDERFRKYLAWEIDLVNRIGKPGAHPNLNPVKPLKA